MVKINDSNAKETTAGGERQASTAKDEQNPVPKSQAKTQAELRLQERNQKYLEQLKEKR